MFTRPHENVWEFGFMPGQRVADFGAGHGHYSLPLSHAVGEHGLVYSVDINPHALSHLRSTAKMHGRGNINLILGDLEDLGGSKLGDERMDGVVISNLLHLLEEKERTIKEAKRILKSGGRICVVDWTDKFPKRHADILLRHSGLEFVRHFPAGDNHYVLIFKK